MPNRSSDDKFIILIDKISEIGERTARMEAEQKNIKEDLEEVKRQDAIQNKLLDEHIKGVETANARLDNEIEIRKAIQSEFKNLNTRVGSLEETPKFLKSLKKVVLYIAATGGAITAIYQWFKS